MSAIGFVGCFVGIVAGSANVWLAVRAHRRGDGGAVAGCVFGAAHGLGLCGLLLLSELGGGA